MYTRVYIQVYIPTFIQVYIYKHIYKYIYTSVYSVTFRVSMKGKWWLLMPFIETTKAVVFSFPKCCASCLIWFPWKNFIGVAYPEIPPITSPVHRSGQMNQATPVTALHPLGPMISHETGTWPSKWQQESSLDYFNNGH